MPLVDLSIVMICRTDAARALRTLDSIAAETALTRYEVIIAGIELDEHAARELACHASKPRIVALPAGTNDALARTKAASNARGKYIALIDAGSLIIANALDKIVAFAGQNPDARIWGGRLINTDGSVEPGCWQQMRTRNLFWRALGLTGLYPQSPTFNSEGYGGWQRDCVRNVDIITSGFFLIERELWGGLRGFDPLFGDCGSDADLCLRARAFSARPMFTPAATIEVAARSGNRASVERTVTLLEAKATLIRRHWEPSKAPIGLLLLSAWPATRAIAFGAWYIATGARRAAWLQAHWSEVWRRRSQWRKGSPQRAPGHDAHPHMVATAPLVQS